jgi:hypothetical protein
MLTGGEPMLRPLNVFLTMRAIRKVSPARIIVYTADVTDLLAAGIIVDYADGLTLTLHTQADVIPFIRFNNLLLSHRMDGHSLRLNVFANINLHGANLSLWKVKHHINWIKNCPLPEDEVFMRL